MLCATSGPRCDPPNKDTKKGHQQLAIINPLSAHGSRDLVCQCPSCESVSPHRSSGSETSLALSLSPLMTTRTLSFEKPELVLHRQRKQGAQPSSHARESASLLVLLFPGDTEHTTAGSREQAPLPSSLSLSPSTRSKTRMVRYWPGRKSINPCWTGQIQPFFAQGEWLSQFFAKLGIRGCSLVKRTRFARAFHTRARKTLRVRGGDRGRSRKRKVSGRKVLSFRSF